MSSTYGCNQHWTRMWIPEYIFFSLSLYTFPSLFFLTNKLLASLLFYHNEVTSITKRCPKKTVLSTTSHRPSPRTWSPLQLNTFCINEVPERHLGAGGRSISVKQSYKIPSCNHFQVSFFIRQNNTIFPGPLGKAAEVFAIRSVGQPQARGKAGSRF